MRKPKVLLIEDEEILRGELIQLFKDNFRCKVVSPSSFAELKEKILLNRFDGVLIDIIYDNQKWLGNDKVIKIGGFIIRDGIDVADYFRKNFGNIAISFFSANFDKKRIAHRLKKFSTDILMLPKALPPDHGIVEKKFIPVLEPINENEIRNSKFKALDENKKMTNPEKSMHYKNMIYEGNRQDLFAEFNDCAWQIDCGDVLLPKFMGPHINSNVKQKHNSQLNHYPDETEITNIGINYKSAPLIFWNTRIKKFIEKQFDLAGSRLQNIPRSWLQYFNVSLAISCVNAYYDSNGGKDKYIDMICQLDDDGIIDAQLEVVMKHTNGHNRRKDIEKNIEPFAEKTGINLFECFVGRVGEIENNKTVWVELKSLFDSEIEVSRPLDYERLKKFGVKYKESRFLYKIFETSNGIRGTLIEPVNKDFARNK